MTEYEPYGARHFLRDSDAEGISELRRQPIPLRDGSAGRRRAIAADTDRIDPAALAFYRTLVVRRSPDAEPPAGRVRARLAAASYYEVWQRARSDGPAPRPARRSATPSTPYGVPRCDDVLDARGAGRPGRRRWRAPAGRAALGRRRIRRRGRRRDAVRADPREAPGRSPPTSRSPRPATTSLARGLGAPRGRARGRRRRGRVRSAASSTTSAATSASASAAARRRASTGSRFASTAPTCIRAAAAAPRAIGPLVADHAARRRRAPVERRSRRRAAPVRAAPGTGSRSSHERVVRGHGAGDRGLRSRVCGRHWCSPTRSVVVLALPDIYRELDVSVTAVTWVLVAFNLVLALAAVPAATLARRRRRGADRGRRAGAVRRSRASSAASPTRSSCCSPPAACRRSAGAAAVCAALELLPAVVGSERRAASRLGRGRRARRGARARRRRPAHRAGLVAVDLPRPGADRRSRARSSLGRRSSGARPRRAARPSAGRRRPHLAANAALALVSAALAAALFLVVLLLIEGWRLTPIAAAAAVTVMPISALAAAPLAAPGRRRRRAGRGGRDPDRGRARRARPAARTHRSR